MIRVPTAAWEVVEPRQITGAPYRYYGLLMRHDQPRSIRNCCYRDEANTRARDHRGSSAARKCAAKTARRLNRGAA